MLKIKNKPCGPFNIKGIRNVTNAERSPTGSACSIEADDGTDKPPC